MAGERETIRESPSVALQLTATREQAEEWALVLVSQGLSPRVRRGPEGWILAVPLDEAAPASAALAAYLNENPAGPATPARDVLVEPDGTNTGLLVAGVLIAFFLVTGARDPEVAWFAKGSADAGRILDGELWRTVTALTLHADLAHVLANAILGALLIGALCGLLGSGLAVLLVLAAGAAGNFANALLQTSSHVSIGASTAVFAALGLLAAVAMARRRGIGERGRRVAIPVAAGLGILAMLGVGGERVDLWAHLLGFACGVSIGLANTTLSTGTLPPTTQRRLATLAVAVVVGCWVLALR